MRRTVDRSTYEQLLKAFRTHGLNLLRVSEDVGVSRNFARRAYTTGWVDRHAWALPIASVLEDDTRWVRASLADQDARVAQDVALDDAGAAQRDEVRQAEKAEKDAAKLRRLTETRERAKQVVAARAAAAQEADEHRRSIAEQALREREEAARRRADAEAAEEAEREKARQQAVEARTQEAQLVRLARGAAIGTLGGTMRLMPALAKLADQLRAAVDAGGIPPEKAATVINQISRTVKDATVAAQVVIELERLHLGAPQAIIGVVQHEVALEDAAQAVDEFAAAVQRSKELGLVDTTTTALGGKSRVAQA